MADRLFEHGGDEDSEVGGPVGEELGRARRKAIRLLSIRPRSEEELRRALARADYSASAIETIIDRLRRDGTVDDRVYAETFADERRRLKGHAPTRIEIDLRSRGIGKDLARQAAWETYEDPGSDPEARLLDEAITLLRRKQVHYEGLNAHVARRRMASVLGRAGYPGSIAHDAVDAVVEEMESEGLLVTRTENRI